MQRYIIGCDEVGLGSWAGPMYVCAFAAPEGWSLPGLNDSKKLDTASRAALYRQLYQLPLALVRADAACVDGMGVRSCLVRSHTLAIHTMQRLYPQAEIIVDGIVSLPEVPTAALIPKADGTFPAVMAASVVAKHVHDLEMQEMHRLYPGYGFSTGVGYGTAENRNGLAKYGLSPIHRRSYAPMKNM